MTSPLTIGMATYKDLDGVYFTLQSLHAHHPRVEYLVIDNAPESCPRTRDVTRAVGGRYLHRPDLHGTSAPRDALFRLAKTPWVMCLDSHVILEPDAVQALLDYIEANPDSRDLIQGPLIHDDGKGISTHWQPTSPPGLWGVWDTDKRCLESEPFDIPMQGLGLFAMRREAWPGFHPRFVGFGGEEGYIHEKVRQRGGRCLCLPALRWRHRFRHMEHGAPPPPYPLRREDQIWNLLIGHRELGIDAVAQIRADFGNGISQAIFDNYVKASEAVQPFGQSSDKKRLKLLGVWYTNNAAPEKLLKASLGTIQRAASETMFHDVRVTTSAWKEIPGNLFACYLGEPPAKGHAAILHQIERCIQLCEDEYPGWDYDAVVFLEHDVLYAPSHFDRLGNALAGGAPVASNLDYEGLNATGWLKVKERHEPMHQLAMRRDVALVNLARAEEDCVRQGWAYLEPDSVPRVTRSTTSGLLAADFDGTLTAGWKPPSTDFVVITGRGQEERSEVERLTGKHLVYYRPHGVAADNEGVGRHKADTIRRLGVVEFWEGNAAQVEIIRQECPGVVVHHASGSPAVDRSDWARLPFVGLAPSIHVNW